MIAIQGVLILVGVLILCGILVTVFLKRYDSSNKEKYNVWKDLDEKIKRDK